MKKPLYRRKRFWFLLFLILLLAGAAIPFILNPLKSFHKTVNYGLKLWGIKENNLRQGPYRIHYYEGGKEHPQTVILIHGFGGNAGLTWMQLMPALVKKYHVVAPDLLASNFLRLHPDRYSIDSEVKIILALMDQLKIEKASLVGLSVGGWVSLLLAVEYPARVEKLILVESAGLRTEIPELAHLTLTDRPTVKRFLKMLFYNPPPLPGFVLDQMVRNSKRIMYKYRRVFAGFLKNSEPRLLDGKLKEIQQPTLVIHGREDQVIPLEVGKKLHEGIPNSELIILEETGHGVVWDSPWQLRKAILEFLGKDKPLPPSPSSSR